jgi:predicted alpha-1,2-mannosidase
MSRSMSSQSWTDAGKRVGLAALLALAAACADDGPAPVDVDALLDAVDPFIGSGGVGFGVGSIPPGPTLPFGLAKPGPDTSQNGGAQPGFSHCAGYWWEDDEIRAFSQIHLSGTGVPDYGALGVMPLDRRLEGSAREGDWRARFDHRDQVARVGRFETTLQPSGIRVAIGATARMAVYRFTYPARAELVVDLAHGIGNGTTRDGAIRWDAARGTFTGWLEHVGSLSGGIGGWRLAFAGRFDRAPTEVRAKARGRVVDGTTTATGADGGLVFGFGERGDVGLQLAVSFVDEAAAEASLTREDVGFDLDRAEREARAAWAPVLERVVVDGGTDRERRIFYSSLFRTHHMPTTLSEPDGRYVGIDDAPHVADGFVYRSDLSLWDTFRTLHPLFQLVYPEANRDALASLAAMQRDGGGRVIGRWPLATGETWTMIGSHGESVIADAALRGGVAGLDLGAILDAQAPAVDAPQPFLGEARANRECIADWTTRGFCPEERGGSTVSRTLENAFNDALRAAALEKLGRTAGLDTLRARAGGWRQHFDPASGWLRARPIAGGFTPGFDPAEFREEYTEGNARQWLFFVPHDVEGLAALSGGVDALVARFESIFEATANAEDTPLPDLGYWHGNEPDIHAAYLFTDLGRPERTHHWVDWIMSRRYDDSPAGLDGNDDGGTLSAWYVWSALGLYPKLATDRYYLARPTFPRAAVRIGDHTLVLERAGEGARVAAIEVDGRVWSGWTIDHAALVAARRIVFRME